MIGICHAKPSLIYKPDWDITLPPSIWSTWKVDRLVALIPLYTPQVEPKQTNQYQACYLSNKQTNTPYQCLNQFLIPSHQFVMIGICNAKPPAICNADWGIALPSSICFTWNLDRLVALISLYTLQLKPNQTNQSQGCYISNKQILPISTSINLSCQDIYLSDINNLTSIWTNPASSNAVTPPFGCAQTTCLKVYMPSKQPT